MKKLFFLFIISCVSMITAKAQLANTKWEGQIALPAGNGQLTPPIAVVWAFTKDTLTVTYPDASEEVMTYTTDNDMLMIKKISGNSPCDVGAAGKYQFQLKDDMFSISLVEDECEGRSHVDYSRPLHKKL
jgi:hypothetical protein